MAAVLLALCPLVACGGGGGGGGSSDTASAQLRPDPNSPHWLSYAGGGNPSFFLAGAGGPEGFLYLSDARKNAIIDKLVAAGGNGIYFQAVRSHGGDGNSDENPFVGGDSASGVDTSVLDSWEPFFQRMDDAGITLFFFLYDDNARPFDCGVHLSDSEAAFVETLVSRFKHHRHLIWMTQEEFDKSGGCPGVARQRALAAAIRATDPVHAIGVHHMNGQGMQFAGDPNIDLYGQQAGGANGWVGVDAMHDRAGKAGWGSWVYVMAEAHPWHRDLLAGGNANRAELRKSFWATALAGGYVLLYDAFETHDPTDEMLGDLRRLQSFMESTELAALSPADELAFRDTKWVLANPAKRLYVLYSDDGPAELGVRGLPAGTYRLSWFDPEDGARVDRTATVASGDNAFPVPAEMGAEAALYVRR